LNRAEKRPKKKEKKTNTEVEWGGRGEDAEKKKTKTTSQKAFRKTKIRRCEDPTLDGAYFQKPG